MASSGSDHDRTALGFIQDPSRKAEAMG